MTVHKPSTVRSAALRSSALSLAKACSIGLRSPSSARAVWRGLCAGLGARIGSGILFALDNARKDLRYYTNMAENLPISGFVAEAVHQTFVLALNRGYRDKFVPRLIDLICEINNVKLKKP